MADDTYEPPRPEISAEPKEDVKLNLLMTDQEIMDLPVSEQIKSDILQSRANMLATLPPYLQEAPMVSQTVLHEVLNRMIYDVMRMRAQHAQNLQRAFQQGCQTGAQEILDIINSGEGDEFIEPRIKDLEANLFVNQTKH